MRTASLPLLVSLLLAACGPDFGDAEESAYLDHDMGSISSGLNLGQAGGCATAIADGINRQLIEELNCISPNLMSSFAGPDTRYSATVVPYLHPTAVAALHRATAAAKDFITINSAYRTVAQQYLLYRWWQAGKCDIQLAAPPGDSNHQSGRALDVQAYTYWRSYLTAQGWTWLGTTDVVHYNYLSAPSLGGKSVLAFQKLWNKNNSSKLVEDGVWGPASAGAMAASPVTGFPKHGCAPPPPPPTGTVKGVIYRGTDATAFISGAKVTVGSTVLTTGADGAYSATLASGMYTIKVTATGYVDGSLVRQVTGGQTVVGSIGLTPAGMPDAVAPDLAVSNPSDMSAVDVAQITVSGTVSDSSGGAVTLTLKQNAADPVPVMVGQGMFAHQVTLKPGPNTFELVAKDAAGNATTVHVGARFRAGLEGEVTTPDERADPLMGVLITLSDASGTVIASTQSGGDGKYGFDLDDVPVHVKLRADAQGYQSFVQELDVGADSRQVLSFAMSRGEGETMNPAPMPTRADRQLTGGCAAAPALPLALLGLMLLRRRRR